jgi:hypothetical protein
MLAILWILCRYRHKIHYADVIVMPTLVVNPLVVGVSGLLRSA